MRNPRSGDDSASLSRNHSRCRMISGYPATHSLLVALFALAVLATLGSNAVAAQPSAGPTLPDSIATPTVAGIEMDLMPPALSAPASADLAAGDFRLSRMATVYLPLIQRGEKYPPANRAFELEVLRLVNEQRAAAGLWPLVEDPALTAAARRHAMDMAVNNLLSHTGSDGSTAFQRMAEEGFAGTPWTEAASLHRVSAESTVNDGWMKSTYHRDIVLDRTSNCIGMGVHPIGSSYAWVIDLGVYPKTLGME